MEKEQAFNNINAGNALLIDVPYELSVNNIEYKGIIQFRFPNVRDEIMIGLEEAKLRGTLMDIGGQPELITVAHDSLDRFTQFLVEGLSSMKVLAIPQKNIKFEQLPQEVIVEIYRGYLRAKNGTGTDSDGDDSSNTGDASSETSEQSSKDSQV